MSLQNPVLHFHISKKRRLTWFDKFIMLAAVAYPLTGLPQVVEVFSGHTAGVSLLAWAGFMGFSSLFLVYGLIHKIQPMILTNGLWLVVDGLVVMGILIHRMA